MRRKIIIGLLTAVSLLTLASCSKSHTTKAANELTFDFDNIADVVISYDEEPITFFQSDSDELIIKEYMTENKHRYYANVKQSSSYIQISEGRKPFFKASFSRYIEVYYPKKYQGNLTVTTTNGNINMSDIVFKLSSLRINTTAGAVHLDNADASVIHLSTTSGAMDLGDIKGEQIRLESTRGTIACQELCGTVNYTSTSGDIDVISAVGSGTYKANNSGKLQVVYTEVTGDLSFFNKNDNINLTLPQDLEFEFEAVTKNGSVSTSFQENMSIDKRTARGIVGSNPTVTVKAETNNGNIQVMQ